MKKKHRDITVDNVKYAWMFKGYPKDGHLTIWKDKKVIYSKDVRQVITPRDVATIIKGI